MSFLDSLQGVFSNRCKATSLYKRGMAKAKKRDTEGAIADYTAILNMRNAPEDVKAMARFNRALAYSSAGEYENAKEDLNSVLAAEETPANIQSAAEKKLRRYQQQVDKSAGQC